MVRPENKTGLENKFFEQNESSFGLKKIHTALRHKGNDNLVTHLTGMGFPQVCSQRSWHPAETDSCEPESSMCAR